MPQHFFSFVLRHLKPFRWHIVGLMIIALLWAADLSLSPYLIKLIIDRVAALAPHQIWDGVFQLIVLYVALSFFMSLVFRIWNLVRRAFIPALKGHLTTSLASFLLEQSYRYYQNYFAGSLANKVNDVSYGVAQMVEIVLEDFFANLLAVLIATTVLLWVNTIVAIIFVVWAIFFVLGSRYFAKNAHQMSHHTSELRSQLTGKVVDILGNMSIVRLFVRQKLERENIQAWTGEMVSAEKAFDWQLAKLFAFQSFSFVTMQAIVLFYLAHIRSQNAITVGDFALVLTINTYMLESLWNLGRQFLTFAEQLGKVTQGLRILVSSTPVLDLPEAKPLQLTRGEIVFDQVDFHYYPEQPLFSQLSLTIPAGQKVGLVGYSGSGKTTFTHLILRLFDITGGVIYLDGQAIQTVTQSSLRQQISFIPQEPTLFHRSLFDNIAYGSDNPTEEKVIAAAKLAHAHEFIEKLPQKYQSLAGERGIQLSGGQRQRIAIARAILKNAPILLLDEATSALDSITEQWIQESLQTLMEGKTTLVIAHRLSTLMHMDRILVFDQGKIVEEGTHESLLSQRGLYAQLWESQSRGFLLN